ncbi:MAG: hypothetical protein ICV64_09260 [Thermoleophilia bacterium]|nr:hypothetical protein [Thermoleophilia bacterium]
MIIAVLALGLAAPANAGNRQLFFDPAGDNEGRGTQTFASDITQIEVTSQDNGSLTVAVTLLYSGQRLEQGDILSIRFDTNRDGNENFRLVAFGNATGPPTFNLCTVGATQRCELGISGTDRPGAAGSHVVTFELRFANWFVIDVAVVSEYEGRRDVAGVYTFNVNADPDRDGRSGAWEPGAGLNGDRCPTVPGGRYDSDRDGCPGPFERLPTPSFSYNAGVVGSQIVLRQFRIRNAPRGVPVYVRVGSRTVRRRGSGPIGVLQQRPIRVGTRITITYAAAGKIGRYKVVRFTARGFRTVRTGCTALGSRRPARCP